MLWVALLLSSIPVLLVAETAQSTLTIEHHGDNLVPNPGFESGLLLPAAWTVTPGDGAAARQTLTVYNGSAALQVAGAGAPSAVAATVRSTQVPMLAGASVAATALVRDEVGRVDLRLEFTDHVGALVGSVPLQHAASASWHVASALTVAPPCTASMQVVVRALGGAGQVDDVYVSALEPVLPTPGLFSEGWDRGLQGWTVQGSGADVVCDGTPAPALRIDAACCHSHVHVIRNGLDIPLNETTRVSFDFQGSASTRTDADVVISLSPQSAVALHMTGSSTNRQLTLQVDEHGSISRSAFFHWSPSTWYRATVVIDPVFREVVAHVHDAHGDLLATSLPLALPRDEDLVAGLVFQSIEYARETAPMLFDTVRIARDPTPQLLYEEEWEDGLGSWQKMFDVAQVDCTVGRAGCSLLQDPACCGTYVNVTDQNVDIPLEGEIFGAFWFRGASSTQTDAHVFFGLSVDHSVGVHLNGGGSNRDLTLQVISKDGTLDAPFFTWEAGRWYEVRYELDVSAQTVRAVVRDVDGRTLAVSGVLPLPSGESVVDAVSVQSMEHVSESAAHWVDGIRIYKR